MSAGNLGSAVMTFGGDDTQFQQVATRVEQAMKVVSARMREASSVIDEAWGSAAKSTEKASGGLEGMVIKFGKLSLASTAAKHVGTALEDMSTKIRAGQASVSDLVDEVVKGIPIVGGFWEGVKGVTEFVRGEKAATELLKIQTAEMTKHLALLDRIFEAHEKVAQAQRDQAKGVAVGLAGKNVPATAAAILGSDEDAEKNADRIRKQVRDSYKSLFEEIDKQKTDLAVKLQFMTIDPLSGGDMFTDAGTIKALRKQFDDLEKESARLRKEATDKENAELTKAGQKVFVQLGGLAGGEVAKGLDTASASLKRFYDGIPVASRMTEQLIASLEKLSQSHAGNIGQFIKEMGALNFDRGRGAISSEVFDKLSNKSFFDQAARSVGSILQQYAPIVETITRLIDSATGASNFATRAADAIGGIFPGKVDQTPPRFISHFEGLEESGRRIQAAAASGPRGKTPEETLLQGIQKAAEKTAAATAEAAKLLKNQKGPIG